MRTLIILLALLLPLQLSWAAMAPYCQDGHERNTAHPGHHAHAATPSLAQADGGDGGDTQQGKGSRAVVANAGCSLCDFSCMKPIQAVGVPLSQVALVCLTSSVSPSTPPASHIAEGPDKPNWLLAA